MSPQVTVIGCDGRPPSPEAVAALAAARAIVGAPRYRHLVPAGTQFIELRHLGEALDAVAGHSGALAVLASGDPGFFGIVRALRARGMTPDVIPAVSSIALAFAKIGLDWDDALILSAHGPAQGLVEGAAHGRDPRKALAAAIAHPKAAILTAPGTAAGLGQQLRDAGKTVYVAELLGTPEEKVGPLSAEPPADPNILISLDEETPGEETPGEETPGEETPGEETPGGKTPGGKTPGGKTPGGETPGGPRWLAGHQGAPDGWALPETAFTHRDSMITKAEVRALILARLGPGPGRTIWDVGAGSGSVAVECARFGAYVIAVESDPAQCARIRENAERHQVRPRIVRGRAPAALQDLPPADAVFAGGGDRAVLDAAIKHANPHTVVVTLAAVTRLGETVALLTDLGYRTEGVQLQASRLTALPGAQHRLAAENPVFVLWGQR